MSERDFLQSIWPETGFYCIAIRRSRNGAQWWEHTSFESVDQARSFAIQAGQSSEVYFAIHALKQGKVWNPNKPKKDKTKGAYEWRTHANMRAARCFFGDIDIGQSTEAIKKYPTREAGIAALIAFVKVSKLPKPWIVSSGGGFHVYWPLEDEVPSNEWRAVAIKFKELVTAHGLRLDPTRIADQSSVLRVPGTYHHKTEIAKPVEVIQKGTAVTFEAFSILVDRATLQSPSTGSADDPFALLGDAAAPQVDAPESYQSQPISMADLGKACSQVRYMVKNPNDVSEPMWLQLLNSVRWVIDGRDWCHKVSSGYATYDFEETDTKITNLERMMSDDKKIGPSTCGKIADICGAERCAKCWYFGKPESSPIVAARRMPAKDVEGDVPMPDNYTRLAIGGIQWDSAAGPIVISSYPMKPLAIINDPIAKTKAVRWEADVPREGKIEFLTKINLYETRDLAEATANAGVIIEYGNMKLMRDYMSAYIKQLQKFADNQSQHTALGWNREHTEFVLPDRKITATGNKPVVVSSNVMATMGALVRSEGTIVDQVALLRFYNHPDYMAHQFMIACSLASPLFHATGDNGVVVNMAGDPGCSKSMCLYTASSLWGDPEGFTFNGTEQGSTRLARLNRLTVLSNLPFLVDEITHMSSDDAKGMVMAVTQKHARIGMAKDGNARVNSESFKSTMMLSTSNNSFHELLSRGNAAGTAGSMRLFELAVSRVRVHSPAQADDFKRRLNKNYGWIGPKFLEMYLRFKDEIDARIVEEKNKITNMPGFLQAERFWADVIAVAYVTMVYANRWGLIAFDAAAMRKWAIKNQLDQMRDMVLASYTLPVDSLMSFFNTAAPNILCVKKTNLGDGITVTRNPRGEMVGRFEIDANVLYISLQAFRDYAAQNGMQFATTVASLEADKIITKMKTTLGRGTVDYNLGQSWTYRIDLTHPAVSGRKEFAALTASNVVAMEPR